MLYLRCMLYAKVQKDKQKKINKDSNSEMKNQSRIFYCCRDPAAALPPKKRCRGRDHDDRPQKRAKVLPPVGLFDLLTEDLILIIFSKLSSSANKPSDLINVLLTCRRLKKMVTLPLVLSQVSKNGLGLKARNWNKSAERFVKRCIEAGSLEACYFLGMIYFYCFNKRKKGRSLITRAEIGSHPEALYSLAIINFNGSGGSRKSRDESAAFKLCTRAASYGHINGLWELIHRLMGGYGVSQDTKAAHDQLERVGSIIGHRKNGSLHDVRVTEVHPANQFMVEWFTSREKPKRDLRICSHKGCGRMETRPREFWRCFVCGYTSYCSLACQAINWKHWHKEKCILVEFLQLSLVGCPSNMISRIMESMGY